MSGTVTIGDKTFTVTQDGIAPPTTTIQFSAALYVVGEGDQRVTLTVTRSGNTYRSSERRLCHQRQCRLAELQCLQC